MLSLQIMPAPLNVSVCYGVFKKKVQLYNYAIYTAQFIILNISLKKGEDWNK